MTTPDWRIFGIATLLVSATGAAQAQTTVYSNNIGGDSFTNPSGVNQGQAVGTSGWYYNNVRAGGVAGISGALPRSGNGSVGLSGPAGAKADIEFLPQAVASSGNYYSTVSMGAFTDLASMSYDWYRSSSSTAQAWLHPSLRVLVDVDGNLGTVADRAALIFELAYNPSVSPVATNQWVSNSVGSSTILWGNTPLFVGPNPVFQSLATWQSQLTSAQIIGFSSGIGSGWAGTYDGAVDNIGWTIGGTSASYNFEVSVVPEPSAYLLAAASLVVLGVFSPRRRRPQQGCIVCGGALLFVVSRAPAGY